MVQGNIITPSLVRNHDQTALENHKLKKIVTLEHYRVK